MELEFGALTELAVGRTGASLLIAYIFSLVISKILIKQGGTIMIRASIYSFVGTVVSMSVFDPSSYISSTGAYNPANVETTARLLLSEPFPGTIYIGLISFIFTTCIAFCTMNAEKLWVKIIAFITSSIFIIFVGSIANAI